MTILQIVTDVCHEIKLTPPSTLFAAYDEGDTTDKTMLRALARVCRMLAAKHDWTVLRKTGTVVVAAADTADAGFDLPQDFLRLVPKTIHEAATGLPMTPRLGDAQIRAMTHPGLHLRSFWMEGGKMKFGPVWTGTARFKYITKWVAPSKTDFTADGDEPFFDHELMVAGVRYVYRELERLEFATDKVTFDLMMQDRLKMDTGNVALHMGGDEGAEGALPFDPGISGVLW
jgi:hypothetical protein